MTRISQTLVIVMPFRTTLKNWTIQELFVTDHSCLSFAKHHNGDVKPDTSTLGPVVNVHHDSITSKQYTHFVCANVSAELRLWHGSHFDSATFQWKWTFLCHYHRHLGGKENVAAVSEGLWWQAFWHCSRASNKIHAIQPLLSKTLSRKRIISAIQGLFKLGVQNSANIKMSFHSFISHQIHCHLTFNVPFHSACFTSKFSLHTVIASRTRIHRNPTSDRGPGWTSNSKSFMTLALSSTKNTKRVAVH